MDIDSNGGLDRKVCNKGEAGYAAAVRACSQMLFWLQQCVTSAGASNLNPG
jgi:hypothetical protein